jgi:hypothetical protein
MAVDVRYTKAADNSRPHKTHRYDVFGPKLGRNLTIFGSIPLNNWIRVEADPAINTYCERPVVIPDTKSKRMIDFWVKYHDHEELWILQRQSDLHP